MQSALVRSGFRIIQLQGYLNAANAPEFQKQLNHELAFGHESILLVDMGQVETLDSAGLMVLVSTLSRAQRLDCRFCLCSVSPSLRIIFEVTQLDRVFEIFATVAEAEASFAQAG